MKPLLKKRCLKKQHYTKCIGYIDPMHFFSPLIRRHRNNDVPLYTTAFLFEQWCSSVHPLSPLVRRHLNNRVPFQTSATALHQQRRCLTALPNEHRCYRSLSRGVAVKSWFRFRFRFRCRFRFRFRFRCRGVAVGVAVKSNADV